MNRDSETAPHRHAFKNMRWVASYRYPSKNTLCCTVSQANRKEIEGNSINALLRDLSAPLLLFPRPLPYP